MTPKQSMRRLREMLRQAGVARTHADPAKVLAVFKDFADVRVRCKAGPLLFQSETAQDFGVWSLSFVRGYTVWGTEERLTLHIELQADTNEDLGIPQISLMSWDYPTLAQFYRAVERSKAYRRGLGFSKWILKVYLG